MIVTKTDRLDNNLLFVVTCFECEILTGNGTLGQQRREGGGLLINFDSVWNFQFGLGPSCSVSRVSCDSQKSDMETCLSPHITSHHITSHATLAVYPGSALIISDGSPVTKLLVSLC